mgnify:CR=1 FL=1
MHDTFEQWEAEAARTQPGLSRLLAERMYAQPQYRHTLTEILQQPVTWIETAKTLIANESLLSKLLQPAETVLFTGSGSSEYAGDCVVPALRAELKRPVETRGGGWLLTQHPDALTNRPGLVVSLARSGDSPESSGVLDLLLSAAPWLQHLIITCNANGRLAKNYSGYGQVTPIVLDSKTNDQSLVMTSSFTNMVVASRFLGCLGRAEAYTRMVDAVAEAGRSLLASYFDALQNLASGPFNRVVYLGSACRFGAAREAALKMLEMTSGRVATMAETYLGLRHGPMSFLNRETLIVCYLSSDPLAAAYETDLVEELNRKGLGWRKILVGQSVPKHLIREGDMVVTYLSETPIEDSFAPVLDVVTGQLLAFHRCRHEGLSPDMPSQDGVITRVVSSFTLHRRAEGRSVQ